jgi:hypothetical protein
MFSETGRYYSNFQLFAVCSLFAESSRTFAASKIVNTEKISIVGSPTSCTNEMGYGAESEGLVIRMQCLNFKMS